MASTGNFAGKLVRKMLLFSHSGYLQWDLLTVRKHCTIPLKWDVFSGSSAVRSKRRRAWNTCFSEN